MSWVQRVRGGGGAAHAASRARRTYLNGALRSQGSLVEGYFATGHAGTDDYIAQISGQSPNGSTKADCSSQASLSPPVPNIAFGYTDVMPGTDDPFPATNSGQVDGQGCIYPAPNAATGAHGAPTIADQLDAKYPSDPATHVANWRSYNGDMGNDPARDGGTPDPTGDTDCAHRATGGADLAEFAAPGGGQARDGPPQPSCINPGSDAAAARPVPFGPDVFNRPRQESWPNSFVRSRVPNSAKRTSGRSG